MTNIKYVVNTTHNNVVIQRIVLKYLQQLLIQRIQIIKIVVNKILKYNVLLILNVLL